MDTDIAAKAQEFSKLFESLEAEIGKSIVGQSEVVRGLLTALFANGHVLLEGAPGLGKTLLVHSLGKATGLDFARIQFTPDLMPADIVGTNLIAEDSGRKVFQFQKGPVFTNILLADEINRATPKTQSALLEAMQERHSTIAGTSYPMPDPFFVLATQNPIEMEGTYPLPEAQLDRFLVKLLVGYPSPDELHEILDRTTSGVVDQPAKALNQVSDLLHFQQFVRAVPVARDVQDQVVTMVMATHPGRPGSAPSATRFVRYGASPRGAQAILLCAKIEALLAGRLHVAWSDIRKSAASALRHRLILNFEGEAEGVTADHIVDEALGLATASK
jgi:MoxR-like ATPase